jgi:dihydrofolate reductase
MVTVTAIVAMSDNNCIGKGNDLPWYLPDDLKRTKELTMGKPLIMGRKTYESIVQHRNGKPLPGRDSLIISRNMKKPEFENVFVHPSLDDALIHGKEIAETKEQKEVIIFGGAQIYTQALPLTDKIYLTHVHTIIEDGEAFFPDVLSSDEWIETERSKHATEDGLPYSYITLIRKA